MEKKIKTVICGTTFGQFYLEALQLLKDRFEIVGILARGSERSKKCASLYNVPLYTQFEDLPEEIDLACVILRSNVLGGQANTIISRFLERGIHVLQELPIHPKDLESYYRLARKNNVCFYVGNFYAQLPQVRQLIGCAKELNKIEKPAYVQMAFATQVSYPAFNMLMKLLPSIRNLNLTPIQNEQSPFQFITGTIDKIPITMEVHNECDMKDPDSNMYLLAQFSIVYEAGRLTMEDPFGPICWYPRIETSTKLYEKGRLQVEDQVSQLEHSVKILGDYESKSFKEIMTEVWPQAIKADLLELANMMTENKQYLQKAQQELLCARQWNEVNKLIGFPKEITARVKPVITSAQLEEIVNRIKESGIKNESASGI